MDRKPSSLYGMLAKVTNPLAKPAAKKKAKSLKHALKKKPKGMTPWNHGVTP